MVTYFLFLSWWITSLSPKNLSCKFLLLLLWPVLYVVSCRVHTKSSSYFFLLPFSMLIIHLLNTLRNELWRFHIFEESYTFRISSKLAALPCLLLMNHSEYAVPCVFCFLTLCSFLKLFLLMEHDHLLTWDSFNILLLHFSFLSPTLKEPCFFFPFRLRNNSTCLSLCRCVFREHMNFSFVFFTIFGIWPHVFFRAQ